MNNVKNRARILAKLRNAPQPSETMTAVMPPTPLYTSSEKVARLKRQLESMHAEVYITLASQWVDELKRWIMQKELKTLLYGPGSAIGMALEPVWSSTQMLAHGKFLPQLVAYDQSVEQCKESLFTVDASVTSTHGAIAELGALILWPDRYEPRLMSLVPPIHIAIVEAARIYSNFQEVVFHQQWIHQMPTNALLISGPSKTADIELTLTFGIHGPQKLIVFIVLPERETVD